MHDLRIGIWFNQKSRREELVCNINFSVLGSNFVLMSLEEIAGSLDVSFMNEAGVVNVVLWLFSELSFDLFLELSDELGHDLLVGVNVVRSNADLSTVRELGIDDSG